MGWHERHASLRWGSRGILRPEALNLEAWNYMLRDIIVSAEEEEFGRLHIHLCGRPISFRFFFRFPTFSFRVVCVRGVIATQQKTPEKEREIQSD